MGVDSAEDPVEDSMGGIVPSGIGVEPSGLTLSGCLGLRGRSGWFPMVATVRTAHDRSMTMHEPQMETGPVLRRPAEGRIIAGVAAGVADYFGVDVAVVRIAFVVLALVGGAGIPAYLAAWLLIPSEEERYSAAEQWLHSHRPPRAA